MMSCFRFKFVSSGHYEVTYETPVRGDYWKCLVTDMTLIDATKGEEYPKLDAVLSLKKYVRNHGKHYSKHNLRIFSNN